MINPYSLWNVIILCGEVLEGTLSCPDRNLPNFGRSRHYEGICLHTSNCGKVFIQQTPINNVIFILGVTLIYFASKNRDVNIKNVL